MPRELKKWLTPSLSVALAVSLSACGAFRPQTSSETSTPAPTETPKPLSFEDLYGIRIDGPRVYPDGNKYIVFLNPKADQTPHNSGDIANALRQTFNPNANANFINSLGQGLPSQAPECFSTHPNVHGNFDVISPCENQYIILDDSVITSVEQAPPDPSPTPTPDWPATRDAWARATGTALHLTAQP